MAVSLNNKNNALSLKELRMMAESVCSHCETEIFIWRQREACSILEASKE